MREYPLWTTPQRRACLVELALANILTYEIYLFTGNLLNPKIESQIDYWKGDDREERSVLWKFERRRLHALRPQIKKRGQFDSIRREEYLANRPVFEIVAVGISALTFKRVAQVRIPELMTTIWVDLSGLTIGHKQVRKLARYKRGVAPKELEAQIESRCRKAVKRYLNRAPGAIKLLVLYIFGYLPPSPQGREGGFFFCPRGVYDHRNAFPYANTIS